ncbi:MAG: hypothetical protein ACTSWF_05785 [Candidatus Freyarchaeota archaeon]
MNTDKIRKSFLRPILSEILVITTVPTRPASIMRPEANPPVDCSMRTNTKKYSGWYIATYGSAHF